MKRIRLFMFGLPYGKELENRINWNKMVCYASLYIIHFFIYFIELEFFLMIDLQMLLNIFLPHNWVT